MHQSAHVLRIDTPRTAFVRHHTPQHGVKWKESRLTPHAGVEVRSPYVEESPLSIECRVREIIPLGSHDMFIADVVNILADDKYIDAKSEAFDMGKAGLLVYSHGHYYETGSEIGKFGWSVQKKHDK